MIRSIHPFPARMAPDLAMVELAKIAPNSLVLDPMAGSGTVLRHASELGHRAIGFDMDPLAVLMTKVFTTPVNDECVERLMKKVREELNVCIKDPYLPWIDDDKETRCFIDFWFASSQKKDLRRIAYVLSRLGRGRSASTTRTAADILRIALSRIIITKNKGASLARDVSHSRPHKVAEVSNFEVIPAFERSVRALRDLLINTPPPRNVHVSLGDARSLNLINNAKIDLVLTSPPYLNAIDYLRGHRLSLVWLGHRLSDLRTIRSNSIGAERGPNSKQTTKLFERIQKAMCSSSELSSRNLSMIARYSEDAYRLMFEIARVLKPNGRAVLVVGNSCLKGIFIRNSEGFICAASMAGLHLSGKIERELPISRRYLPLPALSDNPLGSRMRTETVISFIKKHIKSKLQTN